MIANSKIEQIAEALSSVEGIENVSIIDTWPDNWYSLQIKVKILETKYIQPYLGAGEESYPTKISFTKVRFEKQVVKTLLPFMKYIKDYSFLDWPTRKSGYADRKYGEKTPSYFDQDTYTIEFYIK
jgi:hypothetical protein